jgi:hypothetical protein
VREDESGPGALRWAAAERDFSGASRRGPLFIDEFRPLTQRGSVKVPQDSQAPRLWALQFPNLPMVGREDPMWPLFAEAWVKQKSPGLKLSMRRGNRDAGEEDAMYVRCVQAKP